MKYFERNLSAIIENDTRKFPEPKRVDSAFLQLTALLSDRSLGDDARQYLQNEILKISTPESEVNIWELASRTREYGSYKGPPLPEHLWWVGYYADQNKSTIYPQTKYAYHATRLSFLMKIIESGCLRGFDEKETKNDQVFGTLDPVEAAFHAYYVGPRDTFREDPDATSIDENDITVILRLRLEELNLTESHQNQVKKMADQIQTFQEHNKKYPSLIGITLGKVIPISLVEILIPSKRTHKVRPVNLSFFK